MKNWKTVVKIAIAVLTALLGAIGGATAAGVQISKAGIPGALSGFGDDSFIAAKGGANHKKCKFLCLLLGFSYLCRQITKKYIKQWLQIPTIVLSIFIV